MDLSTMTPAKILMIIYLSEGGLAIFLMIPLLFAFFTDATTRQKTDFILIITMTLFDTFYAVINSINSYIRFTTVETEIPRRDCMTHPTIFLSVISTQLIFLCPVIIAFDRFLITTRTTFHRDHGLKCLAYSIHAVVLLAIILACVNWLFLYLLPEGDDLKSSLCYSSSIISPSFKWIFHIIKWLGPTTSIIAYRFMNKTWIRSATFYKHAITNNLNVLQLNRIMTIITYSTFGLFLVPDILLVFQLITNAYGIGFLYGLMLFKLWFNFVIFFLTHEKIHSIYSSLFSKKSSRKILVSFRKSPKVDVAPIISFTEIPMYPIAPQN